MSRMYDGYLLAHKINVKRAYEWMQKHIPEIFVFDTCIDIEHQITIAHDASKDKPSEYDAYDAYFYGNNRSFAVVMDFNRAWLNHIHENPHHWQYWVLINDDPESGMTILQMPLNYVIEMICDWWSFSWNTGDLYGMFQWYKDRKEYIKLHDATRNDVEHILGKIKSKLEEINHG